MNIQEYFENIDLKEIERFINDKQEENTYLEFKTVNHPDYTDENRQYDKKNVSEVLSGFGNSNGGIIIWGIKAKTNAAGQDVAKEKKPINELTKFLNLLNRLSSQAVTPPIMGIEHKKLEISNDIGFIKTFVPKSDIAPHMADFSGKHYYKRSGDTFYQCEHYDIVDMLSRKKSPRLKVIIKPIKREIRHQQTCRWFILISIANEGNNIAKYPYLAINFSKHFQKYEYGLDGNRNAGLNYVRNNVLYQHNYSGGINQVIYPGSVLDVDKFFCEVDIKGTPPDLTVEYLVTAEDAESIKGTITIESASFQIPSLL